jgi:hypothetical protein
MLNVDKYIRYEEWPVALLPNKNHLDPDARFDGMLYEHAPAELEHLSQLTAHQVWTLYEENEVLKIRNGFHQELPGRLGYFHCRVYWDPQRVFVVDDVPPSIL